MSTFDGIITEFPAIRVDFFRKHPDLQPPLACFLSHVHSDHLAGLETLRSPFVYCSAATREILLRLERYPCRINYSKGILEARVQTYKHLKNILKPLPLDTPIDLELEPGNHIRVTLFDANHCPGGVMFLFEGSGNAVLYTGDIRSEPWFVSALARNPCIIEYAAGIKTLDKIYLDTSFIEDTEFQTKADGLRELLRKVVLYPANTVFHFQAWTYGYEHVWIALAKALNTKIHVDEYKMRIYSALTTKDSTNKYASQFCVTPEAPGLIGFMCGNKQHPGCLTRDEAVRLHSCEKGAYCPAVQKGPVVWIQPIIAHLPSGHDIVEVGVGGGGDDLERDAELDFLAVEEIQALLEIIIASDALPDDMKGKVRNFLVATTNSKRNITLDLDISSFGERNETELANAICSIAKRSQLGRGRTDENRAEPSAELPSKITFPYSRHSSYPELRHLVAAFRPKDVWPCTVDTAGWLRDAISIRGLFGELCTGDTFVHDVRMAALAKQMRPLSIEEMEAQGLASSPCDELRERTRDHSPAGDFLDGGTAEGVVVDLTSDESPQSHMNRKRDFEQYSEVDTRRDSDDEETDRWRCLQDSQASTISDNAFEIRHHAFQTMIANAGNATWQALDLLSTTDNHTHDEVDLGQS